ncbi:UvrB/UvrC motif-containing protein [Novosphingobium sp. fls2-241-R2A-195]|uniref:UvrB/UvrC motif-containing protein n=1 Tax=Novosphingobium sp. fls2-241-R2A-195 TaxID=3040296 RepID=UPI00254EEF73|nr:UvrB/UvrC motif-containing protein [Novosphingobium sp. fls2-241-R2A-195]
MTERTFRLHDTSLLVSASTGEPRRDRVGDRPDYETFNRLLSVLADAGFAIGRDPQIEKNWPILGRYHREGKRSTPAGDLWFSAETYPTGCRIEFFQQVVTVNSNGGKYDFDRRQKMPYLIGKAFEAALRRMRAHLIERGFAEEVKLESPVPDPMAYFNAKWNMEHERRNGTNRFQRGPDGWPDDTVIGSHGNRLDRDKVRIEHGSVRYFRTHRGHLMRGRVYGGINGMWMVIYGPGLRDHTHLSCCELFLCDPREVPRRLHPRGKARLQKALTAAVETENYERAIVLRDQLKRAA